MVGLEGATARALLPTLILPLHRLDSLDLEGEVDKQRKLLGSPRTRSTSTSGEQRLLLILDGLDELDADHKTGREAASALMTKVDRLLLERNRHGHQLQIVIAGRELIVSALRGELDRVQQIFHVVGYLPIEKRGRLGRRDGLFGAGSTPGVVASLGRAHRRGAVGRSGKHSRKSRS